MKKIVDVAINVYGKPYQTLATLKTLMFRSSEHIDKIYYIQENFKHPYDNGFNFLNKFDNIIFFVPKYYLAISKADKQKYNDKDYRYSLRYQYAWENTDKKYLYITHNDVVYYGDIIGEMLKILNDDEYAGVGEIGFCSSYSCPAYLAQKCNGDKYLEYNPSYDEVIDLLKKYPYSGRNLDSQGFLNSVDKKRPMPLPECRLNEWACLINLEKIRHEVVPFGTTDPFGTYVGFDLGMSWFRDLTLKGYKFKNVDISKFCQHRWKGIWGDASMQKFALYIQTEDAAIEYLEDNFGDDF